MYLNAIRPCYIVPVLYITYFTIAEDGSPGQNYSAMVLVLPHLQNAPEILVDFETTDKIPNNESINIKWEEDSTDAVELAKFLSIREDPENLRIMNQCYMKGKKNNTL